MIYEYIREEYLILKLFWKIQQLWMPLGITYRIYDYVCVCVCVCVCVLKAYSLLTSLMAQWVKNLPAMQKTQVQFLGWEDLLEIKWQPTPVFLPGNSHGQRRLAGYYPKSHKELDTTND